MGCDPQAAFVAFQARFEVRDQNFAKIKAALDKGGNKQLKLEKRPGLNHLYQHATTGLVEEYGEIEETFDKDTLELIAKWVVDTTRKR